MPYSYIKNFRNASHASFARAAVFEEFRGRDARAIDHGDFVDRKPKNVAKAPADDVGDLALKHWLRQAAQADNETDRGIALEIAGEIADLMGLDLIGRRAA